MALKVAVLGCGPAGLLAAHAAEMFGCKVDIFSKKRKSTLYGSQYLHEYIPGIISQEEGEPIKYITHGTPEEYRRKTHGKWWDGIIAPEDFETDHMAWNIREAYDRLWRTYSDRVTDITFPDPKEWPPYEYVRAHCEIDRYDLVVSTVPRTLWKVEGEEFIYSEGWAVGDAPEKGRFVPFRCDDNTIVCDGTDNVGWTRLSRVFGYTTVEWPHHVSKPPVTGVVRVTKPLRYAANGSDNPANSFLHVGRYGKWEKGVVVTDAFNEVIKKVQEMQ